MDVFECAREREGPALDFAANSLQTGAHRIRLLVRDDAAFGQHGDVRLRAGNVLQGELAIEVDGGVDLLHDRMGCALEAATPHLVAHLKHS